MAAPISPSGPGSSVSATPAQDELRVASEKLEAAFLAEVLKSAGVGETPSAFGGGVGEDQFASFLRETQADAMVAAGGIGLAEQIFASLAQETEYGE